MTITRNTIAIGLVASILILAAVLFFKPFNVALGASAPMAPVLSNATTTAITSITTSARIMATTSNPLDPSTSYTRAYASICTGSANPVYLNFDADKPANLATGNVTTVIAAAAGYNACYELTDSKMVYNGSVTASSTNQTATLISVKQYVY